MSRRTARCFHYRKPGDLGLALLVSLLSLALIWMGCLVWIDNSLALIPDNDPRSNFNLEAWEELAAHTKPSQLHQAGQAPDASGGVMVVRGNGDRDDNRPEYFALKRLVAGWAEPPVGAAVSNFNQRRTAVSYKDLGHLKIMSAEGGNSDIFTPIFIIKEGLPFIMGGLSYLLGVKISITRVFNSADCASFLGLVTLS